MFSSTETNKAIKVVKWRELVFTVIPFESNFSNHNNIYLFFDDRCLLKHINCTIECIPTYVYL